MISKCEIAGGQLKILHDSLETLAVRVLDFREALEAVLIFHGTSNYGVLASARWLEITGTSECNSKTLCDHIRRTLMENP